MFDKDSTLLVLNKILNRNEGMDDFETGKFLRPMITLSLFWLHSSCSVELRIESDHIGSKKKEFTIVDVLVLYSSLNAFRCV